MVKYITPVSSNTPAPYIEIEISDILDSKRIKVHALIDTGYDGEIIMPIDLYRDLNLGSFEFNAERTITAETITGERFRIRSSIGNIRLVDNDLTIVATIDTYKFIDEIVIGRAFLESFKLILDGCNREFAIDTCSSDDS